MGLSALKWAAGASAIVFATVFVMSSDVRVSQATAESECTQGVANNTQRTGPISEFRLAIRAKDFHETVRLYRDELGFAQIADWSVEGHGQGVLLAAPRMTFEVLSDEHADFVDQAELGRTTGKQIRFALAVADVDEMAGALEAANVATQLVEARVTPWGDRNIRMATSDDIQLTLFASPEG